MNLFNYLMAKKGHNTSVRDDLFAYLLGKKTPKEVKTATGTTISISDVTREKIVSLTLSKESTQETTTGVQLANIADYSTTKLGVNVSCINNEFILNGTVNSAGSLIGSPSSSGILYMATLPAGTYTFSFKKISGSLNYSSGLSAFYIRNSSGRSLANMNIFSVTQNAVGAFTLTEETDVYLQYYVNTSNWEFTNYDFQIMVLSGDYTSSPIPDFEKYTGGQPSPNPDYPQEIKVIKNCIDVIISDGENENIITIPLGNNEIVGIGTYKDELIVDKNGKCWLNKKTGKVVLNGSETDWLLSTPAYDRYRYYLLNFLQNSINNVGLCNYMILGNYEDRNNTNYITNLFYIGDNNLQFRRDDITNVNDFKTWLSTHNTEVYYVLATENLIDLNYTVDITLFKGINNISNSDDMDMVLKYY